MEESEMTSELFNESDVVLLYSKKKKRLITLFIYIGVYCKYLWAELCRSREHCENYCSLDPPCTVITEEVPNS